RRLHCVRHLERVSRAELVRSIDSMVDAPAFRSALWGVLIVDPLANDTIYAHNAAKLFIPASNQKLVTTSVLLEQLGPDYRFRTVVAARGAIAEQVLTGDLVVIGRGDPTASDHMKGDAMAPLRDIADSLWQHGIRRITGSVVADGNAFPGPVAGFGWPWDQLDGTSFAGVDELLLNEGLSTIRVKPGAHARDPAIVETHPAKTSPAIHRLVVTVARDTIAAQAAVRGGRGGGRGGRASAAGTRLSVANDTGAAAVTVHGVIALGDSASITMA